MITTAIIGAGGFGLEVATILTELSSYKIMGYIDNRKRKGDEINGIPLIGGDDTLEGLTDKVEAVVVAIADCKTRKFLMGKIKELGFQQPTLVHPRSYISKDVVIGEGSIVYPGAVIMSGCVLAEGVLINSMASLGHEVNIKSFSNINPGVNIAGRVIIGECSFLGIGSTILESCAIGDKVIVGAGAVVLGDVPSGVTVIGVPAKKLDKKI